MNARRSILITSMLALAAGSGFAAEPATIAAPSALIPANRIVGLWHLTVSVGPCTGGPQFTFTSLHTYNLGGTLNGTSNNPIIAQGPAYGVWQYDGRGQYRTHFQHFRYLPATGAYDGLTDVRMTVQLDAAATHFTTTVYGRALNPDGSLRGESCGTAIGDRVGLD